MEIFLGELRKLFKYDPGKRGLIDRIGETDLAALYDEIGKIRKAVIVTGFPILPENIGETDGPPGAVNIAESLIISGAEVCLVTDEISYAALEAGKAARGLNCNIHCVPKEGSASFCSGLIEKFSPSHVISIERPGKISGHYRSMRGVILDDYVSDTDGLFSGFCGIKIGIGDGGNELGMGNFKIDGINFSDERSDFALVAGISNWWGWGIGAMVSVALGRNVLPSLAAEEALLKATVDAGAIDGITHKNEMSVDGISLEDNLKVLSAVHKIVDEKISRG